MDCDDNKYRREWAVCLETAVPHQKCYRKETVPHFENVTQIIIRMPEGGYPNGVTHEIETGGNEGI
jgi:hypothetical protein